MLKKFGITFFVVLLVLALSACGAQEKPEEEIPQVITVIVPQAQTPVPSEGEEAPAELSSGPYALMIVSPNIGEEFATNVARAWTMDWDKSFRENWKEGGGKVTLLCGTLNPCVINYGGTSTFIEKGGTWVQQIEKSDPNGSNFFAVYVGAEICADRSNRLDTQVDPGNRANAYCDSIE